MLAKLLPSGSFPLRHQEEEQKKRVDSEEGIRQESIPQVKCFGQEACKKQ